jgi:protein ImuB
MFSIDLLRRKDRRRVARPDRRAILIAGRDGQKRIVAHCCERAVRAGVRPGLPLSEAQALLREEVRIEEWAPDREADALRAIAMWAHRFSPIVGTDAPDALLIDISGSERLFAGEERLAATVIEHARRLGLRAHIGVASTFACARAMARCADGPVTIVPDRQERAALASLPLRALGIDHHAVEALEEVGVERIGQLMDLPRAALPARIGDEPLRRLGQALGEAIEAVEPIRPVAPPGVERIFEGPTTRWEAIELASHDLLERLCALLRERESGARLIEITLGRSDAPPVDLSISLSAPSRDVKHLWSLLRPRVERANMGFGIERIAMRATRIARLRHEQATRWMQEDRAGKGEVDRAFGELVDTLVNRLGPQRTLLIESVDSHAPERVFALRSAAGGATSIARKGSAEVEGEYGDRPFVLFERPEPVAVIALTPDGPALSLRWRERERRIVSSIGPERIGVEWWRTRRHSAEAARDYFKVQDEEGRWLWLFRALDCSAWFVHGVWA